jgi:hypothetical protein
MRLRHLMMVVLSLCPTIMSVSLREQYDTYLHLFKKKETHNSFSIFTNNLEVITRQNYHCQYSNHFYLTQDSDVSVGEYYTSPTIYIYRLNSRAKENQHTLLCV